MKRNEINIDDLLRRHLPSASPEQTAAAQRRISAQLRAELEELREELRSRRANVVKKTDWPGQLEPLVLAAAFLQRGEGDALTIAGTVSELAVRHVSTSAVRFTLHRLQHRGLVSEAADRSFIVTPAGARALAEAKATAKRWIQALGDWDGPISGASTE